MDILFCSLSFLSVPIVSCVFRELVLKKSDKVKSRYAGEASEAENIFVRYFWFAIVNNIAALTFVRLFFHKAVTLAERFRSVRFVCKYMGLAFVIALAMPILELLCKPVFASIKNKRLDFRALAKRIGGFFDADFRFSFIVAAVMMFAVHGFAFCNIMYSHDSLSFGYADDRRSVLISLGKWVCYYYSKYLRLSYAAPFLVGVLATVFAAFSVSLVTKLFGLNRIQTIAVAFVMTANISLTTTFATFIQNGDEYCLALLFACLAVYTHERASRGWNVVFSIIFVTLCLGTYAAYIDCIIGLFVLKLIYDVVNGEKGLAGHILHGVVDVVVLAVGALMDAKLIKLLNNHYGVLPLKGANGPGKLEDLSIQVILDMLRPMHEYFRDYFMAASGYNTEVFVAFNKCFLFLIILVTVFSVFKLRKDIPKALLLLLLLGILPISLSAIYLVSFGKVHWVMIYSFGLVYITPIVMLGNAAAKSQGGLKVIGKLLGTAACVGCLIVGYYNFCYSNGAYTFKKLVYDNTYENLQTIWEDINSFSGYVPEETLVVVMGEISDSKLIYESEISEKYVGCLTGASESAVTYDGTMGAFLYRVMGKATALVYNSSEVEEDKRYQEMPVYPESGYIRWIDDKLVVKISNLE